jgi:hypothetical protein
MADTDNIATVGSEGPISSPGDAKLDALSRAEDASNYIAERESQEREEQGLEPETPAETRQTHIEEALEKAREVTRQAREQDHQLDVGLEQAEREWQEQQQQEQAAQAQYANQLSYYEARGRCMEKAQRLRETNPQAHATISENLQYLEAIWDEPQRKALEAALVYHPEAVWTLALNLSNDSYDGRTWSEKVDSIRNSTPEEIWHGTVQGAANLQQERYVQQRILEDRVAQGRRITHAPPPINPPRGSASVPRDIFKTAEKSNASDYIRMRRAMDARAERD